MSVFEDVKAKFAELKSGATGEVHNILTKLEAVLEHVHKAPVEDIVKTAVTNDLHAAAVQVARVADTARSDVDAADQVVDAADTAVDKAAAK